MPASIRIAPVPVYANPAQESAWHWGPIFAGGAWLIQRTSGAEPPWVFRVLLDASYEVRETFDASLAQKVYQLEHPAIMAALKAAEPTTRLIGEAEADDEVADLLGEDMTPHVFAQLRSVAIRATNRGRGSGALPYLEVLPEPVTGGAGDWVRNRSTPGAPTKWHSFTGDLTWNPAHDRVYVTVACKVDVTGPLQWSDELPDDNLCKRCLPRTRVAQPA